MTSISIIGTGNMGSAIAALAEKAGVQAQVLGHSDTDAVSGDIVVLAIPFGAVAEVAQQRKDQLAGKTVVDITNPLDPQTFSLAVSSDSSAVAQLAAALPESKVVKAFNTNFAPTLATGTVGTQPTTVLVAGDDADAKAQVSDFVTRSGLKAIDAGPLARGRELEALAYLQITLAATEKVGWTGGFAVQQ